MGRKEEKEEKRRRGGKVGEGREKKKGKGR